MEAAIHRVGGIEFARYFKMMSAFMAKNAFAKFSLGAGRLGRHRTSGSTGKTTMRFKITLLSLLVAFTSSATIMKTEVNGTFDSTSYDTPPYKFWGNYFATYFYDMYPQFTNHIYSVSRSGSSWAGQYVEQQEKWCLPLWASFKKGTVYDWMLANDNGGGLSNDVIQWGTNLFNAPHLFWNGSSITNEGGIAPKLKVIHYSLGGIPGDSPDGDWRAVSRNDGAMVLARKYKTPVVDMWHLLWTNGVSSDITNNRLFGYYPGGHPYAAGHLCMALKALVALKVETNVGSLTLTWNKSKASAIHCAASKIQLTGNTLTCTVRFDRMPLAWDVPDGTITNDARNAFVLMPELGNAFRWMIKVKEAPPGTYGISVDGVLTDIATDAELAAGRNWFTNYNGPLWAQRASVLARKREQEGCDPVTFNSHSAGDVGILGVLDLVNYKSLASQEYDTYQKRGDVYINSMTNWISQFRTYDVQINAAARQTNHTFTIAPYTGP
jgi:hypothetical protein